MAYWVSSTGAATWANAESETPLEGTACCTVATMNSNIAAGDTVYLRAGTYNYSTSNGTHMTITSITGNAETITTISSYNSEEVILKGTYGTNMWGVWIQGSSYIKLHGIIFADYYSPSLVRASSNRIEISSCTWRNDTSPYRGNGLYLVELAVGGGSVDEPVSHIWVHDCVFDHCSAGGGESGGVISEGGDALRVGYPSNTTVGETTAAGLNSNITVEDCTFHYAGHATFDNYGKYTVVKNNWSHNEPWYPEDNGEATPNNPSDSYTNTSYNGKYGHRNFHITDTYDSDKRYNLYERNRLGHGSINPNNDGACNLTIGSPGNIIRYNYLFGAMNNNMKTKWGASVGWQEDGGARNRIYNNTLYKNGYGFTPWEEGYPTRPLRGFRYYLPADNPGNVFKNNIVYNSYAGDQGADDIESNTSDPASIETNNWTTTAETNGSVGAGDPKFIDTTLTSPTSATLPNLGLQSDSPCINQGLHLTLANGTGSASTSLTVDDALYFQDGSWGADIASLDADWIAIGTVSNVVQISSIDYDTNVITLASAMTWDDDAPIWLYKNSDGEQVLYGTAPDIGAYEYDSITPAKLVMVLR